MPIWMFIVAQGAVLAYGLLGGVFLAFSDFIMRSLSLVGGYGGVEAMQVINREVFRITKLDGMLTLCDDEQAALESF